ncbi:hypothetical protein BC830DRAFT_466781 [Chytriomyces sp. MP71]|nr:hypothetical protein BC830DRAFT_466781 [Chytriomyces sp. MP71]
MAQTFAFHNFIGNGGLNVQVTPQFKSPTYKQLDMSIGSLDANLADSSGNIVDIQNNGGSLSVSNGLPINNIFNVHIPIDLNPITLLVRIGALFNPSKNFQIGVTLTGADGQKNAWLSTILSNLPGPVIQQLPQILAKSVSGQAGGGGEGGIASVIGGVLQNTL